MYLEDLIGEKNQEVFEKKRAELGRISSLPCLGAYSEAMVIKTVCHWLLHSRKIRYMQLSICYMIKEVFHISEEKYISFMPKLIPNGFKIFMLKSGATISSQKYIT